MVTCPFCNQPFIADFHSSIGVEGPIIVDIDENRMPVIDLSKATSIEADWLQCANPKCGRIIMCEDDADWFSYYERIINWRPAPGYNKSSVSERSINKALSKLSEEELSTLKEYLKKGGE